jgi:hypothetical protein
MSVVFLTTAIVMLEHMIEDGSGLLSTIHVIVTSGPRIRSPLGVTGRVTSGGSNEKRY